MVQNGRYSNGQPSHMTLPFEYQTHQVSCILLNPVFGCPIFRWLLYNVQSQSEYQNTLEFKLWQPVWFANVQCSNSCLYFRTKCLAF